MFNSKPSPNDILLEDVIEGVLQDLAARENDSTEFVTITDQLTKLHAIRTTKDRVSKDALIAAGASLLSVLAIVGYEHSHVVTSKALSLVRSFR